MAINLKKGQKISLKKANDAQKLDKIIMGLGWDVARPKGFWGFLKSVSSIDLDASCILFDQNSEVVDTVWYRQLQSKDGSVQHTGDNLTGEGDGDDEQIIVHLDRVPLNVKTLVFVVSSYSGQTFEKIENAFCRLVNAANHRELARYTLSGGKKYTAQIMAMLHREDGEWKMKALGEYAQGRTVKDLIPSSREILRSQS